MKKVLSIIIGLLIVIIIIISVAFINYINTNKSDNSVSSNNTDLNSDNQEHMLDGPGYDKSLSYDSSKYIEFTDNQCIAIGYITDLNEEKFVERYFPDGFDGVLDYYDFRYPENRKENYGNKFVIIPMNKNVKVTVFDCYIGEDGELYTDNTLVSRAEEPFILLDDYIEYTPSMCVKFEYNGFEAMFPITFSGEDGTLNLTGYETEVKDISLY